MTKQPEKVTLSQVIAHLEAVGAEFEKGKPMVDLKGVLPGGDHHQTAVFLRFPYPGVLDNSAVKDRVLKLLTSINRPDTIKCDIYTVCGGNVKAGFQPTITWPEVDGEVVQGGLVNHDDIVTNSPSGKYVLQITVDIVHPAVLQQALGMTPPTQAVPKLHKIEDDPGMVALLKDLSKASKHQATVIDWDEVASGPLPEEIPEVDWEKVDGCECPACVADEEDGPEYDGGDEYYGEDESP
jgi:hypothetical protein